MNGNDSLRTINSASRRCYEVGEEVNGNDGVRRFKGHDRETGDPVMLVVLPNFQSAGEAVELARELKGCCDAPIIAIRDAFDRGVVMDYATKYVGNTLQDALKEDPIPYVDALLAFYRYAVAFSKLSDMGIRCDHPTPRTLYFPKGRPQDARIIFSIEEKDRSSWRAIPWWPSLALSCAYLPPEEIQESNKTSRYAYALGLLLYESLTGKSVFPVCADQHQFVEQWLARRAGKIQQELCGLDPVDRAEVRILIRQMTAFDPNERLSDFAEIAKRLMSMATLKIRDDAKIGDKHCEAEGWRKILSVESENVKAKER